MAPAAWAQSDFPNRPLRVIVPQPPGGGFDFVARALAEDIGSGDVTAALLPDADLWFAYTQRSLWQLWNGRESAPFRSTDHEPEMIYVVPMSRYLPALPGGWRWRMTQVGLLHQSNGQSDALSRSWNRSYVSAAFDNGPYAFTLRMYRRLKEEARNDDNPAVKRYREFLEWDIMTQPRSMQVAERVLSPLMGKSFVVYSRKPLTVGASV